MPGYNFPNYAEHIEPAPFLFKNIELYYVDKPNLILTKVLAGRDKDMRDIAIVLEGEKVPEQELRKRFHALILSKEKEKELKSKFELFVNAFYNK